MSKSSANNAARRPAGYTRMRRLQRPLQAASGLLPSTRAVINPSASAGGKQRAHFLLSLLLSLLHLEFSLFSSLNLL